jgi:tripartite-type tricarboxylate transporter receptor subunit TctC
MNVIKKIFALLAIWCWAISAAAADPTKIKIWIGWAHGGPVDIQARLLQKHIQLADPAAVVVIEYHPGSNGGLGLSKFMRHTESSDFVNLYMDTPNILISRFITKTNKIEVEQEVKMGTLIGQEQMLILTSKQSGINSIQDLRSSSKSFVNYGSSGVGSVSHLTTAYLEPFVKQNYNHIPYKGSAAVFPDLINGNLDLFSVFYSSGSVYVIDQRVNAIAITGKRRNSALPNVPTLEEQGIRNYPISAWTAMFVNPNDNLRLQQQAIATINKVLTNSNVQDEYAGRGILIDTEHKLDPNKWWQGEIKKYQTLANLPQFRDLANSSR